MNEEDDDIQDYKNIVIYIVAPREIKWKPLEPPHYSGQERMTAKKYLQTSYSQLWSQGAEWLKKHKGEKMKDPKDEEFNEIERQAKQQQRKESVRAAVQTLSDYERGFIDGMQKQMQSSVDKAVNAMSQRTWVGLTIEEIAACCMESTTTQLSFYNAIEAKLKELNT